MRAPLLLLVAAAVVWVRIVPLGLPAAGSQAPALRYRASDGRERAFLGDYDSYLWLRQARNYVRAGTVCDAGTPACRDTFTNAPVGGAMKYARSLHTAAIVAVHRAIGVFAPHHPLDASAYWVPVVAGVLAVWPAYLLARRLGGEVGGLVGALLVGTSPAILVRTIGGDNDVWNVVLPLAAVAAAASGHAVLAGVVIGLHALDWSGWPLAFGVVLVGLAGTVIVRRLRRSPEVGAAVRTLALFPVAALAVTALPSGAPRRSPESGSSCSITGSCFMVLMNRV